MLNFALSHIHKKWTSSLEQIVPLFADLLYKALIDHRDDLIEAFTNTSKYLDDLLNIDDNHFQNLVNIIYPNNLQFIEVNFSEK